MGVPVFTARKPKRRNKFRPGVKVASMEHLGHLLDLGCWIYWNGKLMHPGWWGSMQMNTLRGSVRGGYVRVALDTSIHGHEDTTS